MVRNLLNLILTKQMALQMNLKKHLIIVNDSLPNINLLPILHPLLVPPNVLLHAINTYLFKSNSSAAAGPDICLAFFGIPYILIYLFHYL